MSTAARPLAAALALLAGAGLLDLRLAQQVLRRPYDVVHVPSGRVARLAALGNRTFLSDLYWLETVQYIGDPRADERGWRQLYPLVDLVTDLDPRHGYAYQTAGIVLSTVGRLEESDRILQKGMEKGPDWWSYPYYIAFNHWFYQDDYPTAARYAELAALRPGASVNVRHLALSLASKSGVPESALAVLRELREAARDEKSAAALDEQIELAVLERDAQQLERDAARFEVERGRPLRHLDELVAAGYLPSLPPDPFGGRYEWNPAERRVHSSVNPFRFGRRGRPHAAGAGARPPGSDAGGTP